MKKIEGGEISGSATGVVVEWKIHNIAYDTGVFLSNMGATNLGKSLMERGADLDVGSTIYDDSHGIASAAMFVVYLNVSPRTAIYDLVMEIFE